MADLVLLPVTAAAALIVAFGLYTLPSSRSFHRLWLAAVVWLVLMLGLWAYRIVASLPALGDNTPAAQRA